MSSSITHLGGINLISQESPHNICCKQVIFGLNFFDLSNICWENKTQTNQLTAITALILEKDSKKDNIQLFEYKIAPYLQQIDLEKMPR